jgi:membrane-bound lytic murein transglycosylase A
MSESLKSASSQADAPLLKEIEYEEIPGWREDDHAAALEAFLVGAKAIAEKPPKTRALGIEGEAIRTIARAALAAGRPTTAEAARASFEKSFVPHRITTAGFVTGYFEPEVEASRTANAHFKVPLLRPPPDLVEVTEANRPPGWDPEIRFARRTSGGLFPYFDRAAIEEGALQGRGLEIAFLEDPVDAFLVHVQGSARLRLIDGGTLRIAFAAKSGHAYTSIGRLAVERGILPKERADKDGLEKWLRANREAGRSLMRENRSYIFFRETVLSENEGPLGAAEVPLTKLRSLAIDRTLHTFHTPIFVAAEGLCDSERGTPFRRMMIAQDTGSAIVGAARGDIFFGSGADAGSLAGRVRHQATMTILVPRILGR